MSREGKTPMTAADIAAALRAAISSGSYAPGDQLPGENALMSEHGVARMTARSALAMLRDEGLTTTRRGVGVFVREFQPIIRNSISRVSQRNWNAGRAIWEADAEGRSLTVDNINVEPEADAPDDVRAVLRLSTDNKVTIRARRYCLDGKPAMIATSYLPAPLVAGTRITEPDTGPGGIYARLADLGHAPAHFREDVIARMPTADETEALHIAPGTPVMVITRTAADANGTPVEINAMTLDAANFVVRYDFDA
ncbi:MAG: GntR family transcriptional regulator [Dermatophilus congolensis]|nr:GntR family transcriptional regulator [Dermatophilus congolensis]